MIPLPSILEFILSQLRPSFIRPGTSMKNRTIITGLGSCLPEIFVSLWEIPNSLYQVQNADCECVQIGVSAILTNQVHLAQQLIISSLLVNILLVYIGSR